MRMLLHYLHSAKVDFLDAALRRLTALFEVTSYPFAATATATADEAKTVCPLFLIGKVQAGIPLERQTSLAFVSVFASAGFCG